ncbi:hypothetical protein [Muriicola marianensis]|nr:hypothetical protein [Muriicola marianensis]
MKKTLLPLCFLALVITSCQKGSSDLDKILLSCQDATYQAEGYDITSIIDSYEKELIEEGVLEDGSGESYLDALQKISTEPDFRISTPSFTEYDPFFKIDNATKMTVFQCEALKIETLKEKDPKWQRFFSNSKATENNKSPEQLVKAMRETLSDTDLNSYYFKLKMFQVFDGVNTHLRNRASMTSASPN